MSDIAIRIENIGKRYRLGTKEHSSDTLVGAMMGWMRSPAANYRKLKQLTSFDENESGSDVLWALRDVSFEVKQGDVIGIIGRNGAGKSTLLKILSRITEPTTGQVEVFGRISSLLEVGTGFHPELTGRENVYLNGTLLGMRKGEIDRSLDAIIDFSGVERFIDTPVKRYSSGMRVRLAFSVAAHLEPEILIIDEVLAVGDMEFQRKCLGKMEDAAKQGRTVLFVSHNTGAVRRLCNRGVVLNDGKLVLDGSIQDALTRYVESVTEKRCRRVQIKPKENDRVSVDEVIVRPRGKTEDDPIDVSDAVEVEVKYRWKQEVKGAGIAVELWRDGLLLLNSWETDSSNGSGVAQEAGTYSAVITIPGNLFSAGRYTLTLAVVIPKTVWLIRYEDVMTFEYENFLTDATRLAHARGGMLSCQLDWKVAKNPAASS